MHATLNVVQCHCMKGITDTIVTASVYFEQIEKWHIEAICSQALYQAVIETKAPNIIGDTEARRNLDVMDEYASFFASIQNSTRFSAYLQTSRIFIGYKNKKKGIEAYSIFGLLNKLDNVKGVDKVELERLKGVFKADKRIKTLKGIRNQEVAHIDMSPDGLMMSDADIWSLLELSSDILAFADLYINGREHHEPYKTIRDSIDIDVSKLLLDLL